MNHNKKINYCKMNGLGNDFIIIDNRATNPNSTYYQAIIEQLNVKKLADRQIGIGCDQLIIINDAGKHSKADASMLIFNANGGRVGACGNATRCVGRILLQENPKKYSVFIQTDSALLEASRADNFQHSGDITVRMPPPSFHWQDIPLAQDVDVNNLPIDIKGYRRPCAVSIGNPHMVFIVEEINKVPLSQLGPELENHPLFPHGSNIEFVQINSPTEIAMIVWERGVGITKACGTGACAALVITAMQKLTSNNATVQMDGGKLHINWITETHANNNANNNSQNYILMTGDASYEYEAAFDLYDFLA